MIVLLSFNYCTLDDAAICAGPSNYESLCCLTSFGGFQRVSLNIKERKCILSFFTVYPDLHRNCFCGQFVPDLRSRLQRWSCNFSFRNSHVSFKCEAIFMQNYKFSFPKCSFKALSWPGFSLKVDFCSIEGITPSYTTTFWDRNRKMCNGDSHHVHGDQYCVSSMSCNYARKPLWLQAAAQQPSYSDDACAGESSSCQIIV